MNENGTIAPVVVGVDGSKHAVRASIWAIDEAVRRGAPLRLVHVVRGDSGQDFAEARKIIHRAWAAVEATGIAVELESDIRQGDTVPELIEASRAAAMICVGSRGVHKHKTYHRPGHGRGTTAAGVALGAHCPVAIIRRRHPRGPMTAHKWVVAALDDSPGSDSALQAAMDEAQRRQAPVLVLTPWHAPGRDLPVGQRELQAHLESYIRDAELEHAEFAMCTLPRPKDIANLLAQSAGIDQLLVIGPENPELVAQVVSPKVRAILHKTNCSVLVMRRRDDAEPGPAWIAKTAGTLVPDEADIAPLAGAVSGQ
ncbi:universal stress protein UspA-like protein [Mycolicibacterium mageritense DSM 44476 = CIP 104973]|uniref:Universal stress protein n=2 Tax=Mycolicibacterium mageritense TaxID=53462 RepID=A0ABM7HLD0_MYCME|nr:universal stress protein [Mycolicibacterium mageritense]BBX31299.1 universal stress protein [Mycolicibacterium mageritense]CDO25046.1 universal stress protein UspA-like protein [Mycolicibacterium mageritense DSM 44476 = CIP 104973]